MAWDELQVVPDAFDDTTIESLAAIYVARISGADPNDVVLGENEWAAVLVAQAEVATCVAAGIRPFLIFQGPPLWIEVAELRYRTSP